ncbi:MAG: hypothetical protein INR65_06785 [Gluconacetobacter diazotrophicus]|nr:hypothetical protein [Gluconacetobacter diazotrophicus]
MAENTERGAAPINGDLEVGYDESFEKQWIAVQYVGLLLMVLFALACVGGLLGRGPYSHRSRAAADGTLNVDFEPVAREETATQITFHVANATALPQTVNLFVDGRMMEPMGLDHVQPQPVSAATAGDGMVLRFTVAPRQSGAAIRLGTMPSGPGLVRLRAWVGSGPADAVSADEPDPRHVVRWTQLVVP